MSSVRGKNSDASTVMFSGLPATGGSKQITNYQNTFFKEGLEF